MVRESQERHTLVIKICFCHFLFIETQQLPATIYRRRDLFRFKHLEVSVHKQMAVGRNSRAVGLAKDDSSYHVVRNQRVRGGKGKGAVPFQVLLLATSSSDCSSKSTLATTIILSSSKSTSY